MPRTMIALAAMLSIGGCVSMPGAQGPVTGRWGGIHIGLDLGPSGGNIAYDCAGGSIGAVIPDAGGRFAAQGTHQPGHGGPVRQGEVIPTLPAHFAGEVHGPRMTFTGSLADGTMIGPFTLLRGAEPTIYRCL